MGTKLDMLSKSISVLGFIFIILFFSGNGVMGQVPKEEISDSKPNILLILTDDQGYHDVSYYGTEDIQTPNIDQLVGSGMRFDNFYANSSVCSPTRAALMTGRYQDYVGVPGVIRTHADNNWGYLNPEAVLLPEVLTQHGYHTALIGKWHLGLESPNIPNERGFQYFHGWLGDMMDDYWSHRRHNINYMRLNRKTIDPEGHATDLFTQWSKEYIKGQAEDESPFFLYLAYNAPHFPVQPPSDWLKKVKKRESDIDETRANLVAFIEHMDAGIGQVVKALKESKQYENTLIIFASDNGGHLPSMANNGPLRDGKQSMYEGGLKVPAGITWPKHITPGSSTDRIALTMDVFPTVLEAAGIEYQDTLEGQSFLPTLLGQKQPKRISPIYFSRREGGTRYGGLTIQAVRSGDWKLLQNSPFEPRELYNLKKDPREKHNVADKYPEKFKELNARMMKFIQKGGTVPWQRPSH